MQRPKVGIGVIVIQQEKILLGKRKSAHGAGTWSLPGGHLEMGETWEECAIRETKEETGVVITNPEFVTVVNDIFEDENKHYVTVYLRAEVSGAEPSVTEPDTFSEWGWKEWHNLPEPLFPPMENLVQKQFNPFE